MSDKKTVYCSFCGRDENQYEYILVSDEGPCICDICIEYARDMIGAERIKKQETSK